jgi:hypothetical protein
VRRYVGQVGARACQRDKAPATIFYAGIKRLKEDTAPRGVRNQRLGARQSEFEGKPGGLRATVAEKFSCESSHIY